MKEMVGVHKILVHPERIAAYLKGEPIYPVTLELGLTARCNRICAGCPSRLGNDTMELELHHIRPLLGFLAGHTRGLIVTGGEPTLSPIFPDVLDLAQNTYEFQETVVVTNGTRLDDPVISMALLHHASAVRVSLYDWAEHSLRRLDPVLSQIRNLRNKADQMGSKLLIGCSALLTTPRISLIKPVAEAVWKAGAHFLYVHPICLGDSLDAYVERDLQQHVLAAIEETRTYYLGHLQLYHIPHRFDVSPISFSGYHASHFIWVIAADAHRYVSTEVKYRQAYDLGTLGETPLNEWLNGPGTRRFIAAIKSDNFLAKGGRNRGLLYNSLIQRLLQNETGPLEAFCADSFLLPHII